MIHQLQKQLLRFLDCRNNKAIIKSLNTNTSHLYGIMWTGMSNLKTLDQKIWLLSIKNIQRFQKRKTKTLRIKLRFYRNNLSTNLLDTHRRRKMWNLNVKKAFHDVKEWDKKWAKKIQDKFNLTDYQMLCLAFAKGFIIGAILL